MVQNKPSTAASRRLRGRKPRRRGQVAVEFAMVAPIVFLFIFASIEFGRALMAIHCMEGAAHDGCRVGILEGATADDVETACDRRLQGGGITSYDSDMTPASLDTAEQWDPITVTITTNYSDISWLPVPDFLGDVQLSATCTLPREAEAEGTAQ